MHKKEQANNSQRKKNNKEKRTKKENKKRKPCLAMPKVMSSQGRDKAKLARHGEALLCILS